jgi:outer membrane receptor protein involved in Fe transport
MLNRRTGIICAFLGLFACSVIAQPKLTGRVLDESGKPVPSVRLVVVFADGKVEDVRATDAGEFALALQGALPARLQAFSPGYAIFQQDLVETSGPDLVITLQASRLADSVTIVASKTQLPLSRLTQSVVVLSREQQQLSPAVTLDDYLRRVPGFALFRRSSSLVAHPTSQGVSMRGVGPSGASRSLVMADNTPLNDPFGGWVYWSRVPRVAIDHVEILRGGASELYGTDALGGVVQLSRRTPSTRTLELEGSLGSFDSSDTSIYASHRIGRHGLSLAGEAFRTEGYVQVTPLDRGSVDIAARSKHRSLEGLWEFKRDADNRIYALVSEFSERRGNGTPLQVNDTQIRSAGAGASFLTGEKNHWSVHTFSLLESFDASFSAVALNRNSESLTRTQRVPAQSAGALASWRRLVFQKHLLLAGADYSVAKGASDELLFNGGVATGSVRADGRQDRAGVYIQDLFQVAPYFQVVLGARWDTWHNHDAFTFSRTFATGFARQTPFPSRKQSAWSPKLGARWDLARDFSLRGSVSRAFRAPTLNELYRSFRVGNVVTGANADLRPERATSGEVGLDWGLRSPLAVRGTFFWYEIDANIANVTLSVTPALITRQRRNLGSTRSRGLELDALYHPNPAWTLSAGYFLSDATVRTAPEALDLVGLRIPQVPRHQAVFNVEYRRPDRFLASLLLRLSGNQFDDDQNRFVLGSYQVVDFSIARPIHRFAELFFACENLFDQEYAVGRTPIETVGMPRRVHGGLRFHIE